MSNFAIIKATGKQYKVEEGKVLKLDAFFGEVGSSVSFPEVLLVAANGEVTIGRPKVAGASVEAVITSSGRGKKIHVIKYKPKVRYRRKTGHRQDETTVKITAIKTAP